jgi:hypothetical protein
MQWKILGPVYKTLGNRSTLASPIAGEAFIAEAFCVSKTLSGL